MSWAAENPEKYDAILAEAVRDKLAKELKLSGFENMDPDTIAAIVEVLQTETSGATIHNAWHNLTTWAGKEVTASEADHFASLIP